MKLNAFLADERPQVFIAASAPVSGAAFAAAPGALAFAEANANAAPSGGHWLTGGGRASQASPAQIQLQRQYVQVLGTTGSAGMALTTEKPIDAVRGVPPRGRPV